MTQKKLRIPIPPDVAADILFKSDRTCCICHIAGKQVQIHHINDDPSENLPENLAVLCLECHGQTQINGGFGRKLNANLVTLYRDHWLHVVEMRRTAESLESELRKSRSPTSQTSSDAAAEIQQRVRSTGTAAPGDSIGLTFRHQGIVITLIDTTWSFQTNLVEKGHEDYALFASGSGAKLITVSTRVLNDAQVSIDLTCSYPIANHVIDDRERRFDSIGQLYKILGNPRCNYNLQPGFTLDMKWMYRVPLDAVIVAFEFEDVTDFSRDRTIKPTRIPICPRPGGEE